PLELPHVERVHAFEPVEIGRLERRHADVTGRTGHPLRQTGGDGEAVRAAARAPGDGEPPDPERIRDRGDVGHTVHHAAPAAPVRAAVAGPVVRDHARSGLDVCALVVVPPEARAGSSVQREDREPLEVAPLRDHQRPPVCRTNRQRMLTHHQGSYPYSPLMSWDKAIAHLREDPDLPDPVATADLAERATPKWETKVAAHTPP